jgi:hypothetical protein
MSESSFSSINTLFGDGYLNLEPQTVWGMLLDGNFDNVTFTNISFDQSYPNVPVDLIAMELNNSLSGDFSFQGDIAFNYKTYNYTYCIKDDS